MAQNENKQEFALLSSSARHKNELGDSCTYIQNTN